MLRMIFFAVFCLCVSQANAGDPKRAEPMEIAALGRSFTLGSLYDVRSEHLSVLNLWDQADIQEGKFVVNSANTFFDVQSVNSFDQKTDFMNIEGNVKMSFLSGLVEVEGSAKYLTDKKSLANSASVSMVIRTRNHTESLTQEFFSNVKYEDYLTNSQFTHVVTKIVYGADAYFQFSHLIEDEEARKKVEGELAADIAGVFTFEAKADITEEERRKYESISVEFNGDFKDIVAPHNYLEASKVVKRLSNVTEVVPMKITLTPLHILSDQITTLLQEINHETIRRAGELRSAFDHVDEKLNDELAGTAVKYFPKLKENILHIKTMFERKSGIFTRKLRTILPLIRNNTVPEQHLIDVLNEFEHGVYHKSYFENWLKSRKRFADTLGQELTKQASSKNVDFLIDIDELLQFQFDNHASFYTLEGSLRGVDESYYLSAIDKNDTSIIENAPEDRTSWVDRYRRPVIGILKRFERLSEVRNYRREDFNTFSNFITTTRKPANLQAFGAKGGSAVRPPPPPMIGFPKRAIFIDMPGAKNKLQIRTYYAGVEIKLKPLGQLSFGDGEDHLQYNKQTTEDIEILEQDDDYPDYPEYYPDDQTAHVEILGYEIRIKKSNKKTYNYQINILKKSTLTPGQRYQINARVVLEGGVRGPWNRKDTQYTPPFKGKIKIIIGTKVSLINPLPAVSGQWTSWRDHSSCNAPCGPGEETFQRLCDAPAPTHGGSQCTKEDGSLGLEEVKKLPCEIKKCAGKSTC